MSTAYWNTWKGRAAQGFAFVDDHLKVAKNIYLENMKFVVDYLTGDTSIDGDLTVGGTVDGRDVAADGAQIDTNTINIGTNATDIATNTSDIADRLSKVDTTTQPIASDLNFAAGKGAQFGGGDVFKYYDSGNWTPTIPGLTLNVISATWRRWGDMCFAEADIQYTSGVGSGSSVLNSPFPAKTGAVGSVSIARMANIDCGGTAPTALPYISQFIFEGFNNNSGNANADFSTFTAGSILRFSAVFRIEEV
jgi:hypothetical protein